MMLRGTTRTKASAASLSEFDERRPEQVGDGNAVLQRLAQVAPDEAADPVPVLHDQRPVDAQLLVQLIDLLLRRERAEDVASDVTGKELRGGEDHDAQQEERDQGEAEPLEEKSSDLLLPVRIGLPRLGSATRRQDSRSYASEVRLTYTSAEASWL